jgi:CelD/BcsL family acetyltransferase involved in cellulose biosynthesis
MLASDGVRRDAKTLSCPFVGWSGLATWDDYLGSRSAHLRRDINRKRRRLAECGAVTSAVIDAPDALRKVIDWVIPLKIDWLARKRQTNNFLPTPEFHEFLYHLGAAATQSGRLVAFVLALDGRTLAAQLGVVDDLRCEMFVAVFDPAFSAHSPGQLLLADAIKWCQEHRLTYDLRIGAEPYKYAWANGDCPATTYHVPVTSWGALMLAGHALRQRWRGVKSVSHGVPGVAT